MYIYDVDTSATVYYCSMFIGARDRVLPCRERLLSQPRLHPMVQEPRLVCGHSSPSTDSSRVLQLQHLQTY